MSNNAQKPKRHEKSPGREYYDERAYCLDDLQRDDIDQLKILRRKHGEWKNFYTKEEAVAEIIRFHHNVYYRLGVPFNILATHKLSKLKQICHQWNIKYEDRRRYLDDEELWRRGRYWYLTTNGPDKDHMVAFVSDIYQRPLWDTSRIEEFKVHFALEPVIQAVPRAFPGRIVTN